MDMDIEIVATNEDGDRRIIRIADDRWDMDSLKGDSFTTTIHPETDPEQIRKEELEFDRQVNDCGVWGYQLQKWNPATDCGWEHVDSICGFVGRWENGVEAWDGTGYDKDFLDAMNQHNTETET